MPNVLGNEDVPGMANAFTVAVTGIRAFGRFAEETTSCPLYRPAACPCGTHHSTYSASGRSFVESYGSAFRFSPLNASTTGISGSGQSPVAPSVLEAVRTSTYSSRQMRGRSGEPGPLKGS